MKSNANDAELIAEAYASHRRGGAPDVIEEFLPAIAAAARTAVKVAPKVAAVVGSMTGSDSEDGEHEDCEAAAQGCTCTDCPDCESNGAAAVDQEGSCGYDQVSEPEPQPVAEEVHTALTDLHKLLKYSSALSELLGQVGNIEGDDAVKIAKACDYLGAVYDRLDYDLNGHSVHNTGYEDAPVEDSQ